MKEKSVSKMNKGMPAQAGFSTLEIMIAFAIMSIVLVAAVGANFASQYWSITSETSNEALYKAKTKLEDLRSLIKQDFYQAASSPLTVSIDPTDPADDSCISGGLCYYVETTVTDLSSCSKYVEAKVEWQVQRYPTTTTSLFTNLTNSPEVINLGGDCILNQPSGNWKSATPQSVGNISFSPGKQFTSIDVLHGKIYVTSNTVPSFLIYDAPSIVGQNPTLDGSYDLKLSGFSLKLNAVDVEEDLATGRTYAFAAVSTTTNQLLVLDVTDVNNPAFIALRTLQNVSQFGSYPEGWKMFIYGGRLYITTRETATNEFHIFDISTPTLPTEIGNGYALNRTVNDMVVRDQKIAGVKHRLVYLAEDSGSPFTKQLRVLDATGDTITELNSVDLPGAPSGKSLFLLGNKLYFGRESTATGPELYVFDVTNPAVSLTTIGQGEVGADVTDIKVSGDLVFVGTNKSGQEFQVWNSNFSVWNPATLNSGRFTSYNFGHLAPLGFDVEKDWVYLISQFAGGDTLQILHTP